MKHIAFRFLAAGMCALVLPAASPASVVLDAPGHAAPEGAAVTARLSIR